MKIGIVIPLKAKKVSSRWEIVSNSLERTVASVLNQSNKSYRVSVIGHDCPDFLKGLVQDGQEIFCKFDELEPPKVIENDEMNNQLKYEVDRCSKILKGIMHLDNVDEDITHWFALDADDLVHSSFVEYLLDAGDYDGFIIDKGYFYYERWKIFNENDEFSSYCGSSSILSKRLFQLPDEIDEKSHRKIPFGDVSHVNMREHLEAEGLSYHVPIARLVTYVRGHGENISDGYLTNVLKVLRRHVAMLVRSKRIDKKEQKRLGVI